jgi:glycosyltransferase involved in cell wall biosynthesis
MRDIDPPAPITIGVPVYNGAAFLAVALENVRQQTFRDFRVLIFDNASDDATPDIAARFVKADSRISYRRNAQNIGAVSNFFAALQAADSPYFLWRAADDTWDLNYIEALYRLLEANPDKDLAVGRVDSTFDGALVRSYRLPVLRGDGGIMDQYRITMKSHPSWIYGLFRTAALKPIVARVVEHYREDSKSWDNLTLLPFMLDRKIVGTDETAFEQALRSGLVPFGAKRAPLVEQPFEFFLERRRSFAVIGKTFLAERHPPGAGRLVRRYLLWLYTNRNVYKLKHMLRRSLRRLVGLRP